jgi:ABC-2 type transport system ATP-binding protein
VISVEGVSKRFDRLQALDGVTFRVGRGEVVGFLGPNGAGKTTTLRIIAGFLMADAGRVLVDDIDVAADPRGAQRRLGYLPEGAPAYEEMRVVDYLAHRARLKGAARARVAAALEAARAGEVAGRRIGQLSRGFRQRVGLADALLADPPVLVLDEPTAGLDPNQLREVRALLAELARERTVLLSSHLLGEVEALAARVVILAAGRVVADAPVAALRAGAAGSRVVVAPADVAAARAALGDDVAVADAGAGVVRAAAAPDECARRLVAAGVAVIEIAPARSLEDVFQQLTGGS